ncbi:hypothetical protein FQN54_003405 [Arachnomyces sp. PD_36]|nr:hypothetical protein FQN54_003405 [Arachnomyces sp. PD_36]
MGAHSPEGQYRVVRKRNRVPLSCAPCRNRKLKCNRSVPCENCVKRGDAASCVYAQAGTRKRNLTNQSASNSPDDMQNRIDRLEGLVLSIMTNGPQSAGTSAANAAISGGGSSSSGPNTHDVDLNDDDMRGDESDTERVTKSFGIMKVDNNKSLYISDSHWASVLHEISEVRQYFAGQKKTYEEQVEKVNAMKKPSDYSGPSLVFGATQPLSEAEIISSFPSKYTADILIGRYFNTYDPATHVLHTPTFQKQYARHWQDPSKSTLVWIGMLFAMMRLALLSYYRDGDEPPEFRGKSLDMAGSYRSLMAQCLVLSDYTKPQQYLLETLILHLHADYSQTKETETSVWILAGMIARLAMRMGYHRDSKSFPNITPFQGEMRRRIWAFVRMADVIFSFQVSLPSLVRDSDSDTELPRNLYDEDFDEDSKEIPPPRPVDEPTPITYLSTKARLTSAFGRVIEHTQAIKSASYETVLDLDRNLRQAWDLVPQHLRTRPMIESIHDPMSLILSRFNIAGIYHKAQCVLHRSFLSRARENPRYAHSRRTCVDSAMELLEFQATMHAETQPGGRLHAQRCHAYYSLQSQDFLVAATIVAVDLYTGAQLRAAGRESGDIFTWGSEKREEMMTALQHSKDIWEELKDYSIDAWKAAGMLGMLLGKLNMGQQQSKEGKPSGPVFEPQDEKQNAAMTLGLLSSGMSPLPTSTGAGQFGDGNLKMADSPLPHDGMTSMDQIPAQAPSPFSNMFGQMNEMQPLNLDWEAWDNYIQSTNLDATTQLWPMLDAPQQQQAAQQRTSPLSPGGIPPVTRDAPAARNGMPPPPVFDRNSGLFMGTTLQGSQPDGGS